MEDKRYYRCSEVSSYGVKMGFVDMRALGEAVGGVLNLNIVRRTEEEGLGHWEVEKGTLNWHYDCENNQYSDEEAAARIKELTELVEDADEDTDPEELEAWKADIESLEDDDPRDIYQYYIISDYGAHILMTDTDEIVLYNEDLDMYVWCVTVFGTPWAGELTDIPLPPKQAA